jgi:hypothetical protein
MIGSIVAAAPGISTRPITGSELTSNAILMWADQSCVTWHYIARIFGSTLDNGRVRSCIRPVSATDAMAAGPDGDRGSRPHQRVALVRLKLFGLARSPAPPVSIMLSFALTPSGA